MLEPRTLTFIALWYLALSIVTLITMWRDKRAARRGGWRTRESTLHALELLGGWPGSILGQRLLRQKSRKVSYRIVLALIVLAHLAIWGYVLWNAR